jgi:3-isopropylmalate/(R)-2-methylmalate dehydratase small subunit
MILKGQVWKLGNDVDTDQIIPVQYCGVNDPAELGKHCMAGIDPNWPKNVKPGDILVAGTNFGCGSSREPAPAAIKACGISCVIAASFARIFYRNAFNIGLPLLECTDIAKAVKEGDVLEVNVDTGEITGGSLAKPLFATPIPPFMQDLLAAGGLMKHVAKRLGL